MNRIAYWLRKLADLCDPRVKPTDNSLVIHVEVDSEQAERKIADLTAACERLDEAMRNA